jgi:WD40 repeat protein
LWTVETGQARFPLSQDDDLQAASFSPDGTVVVTAGYNGVRTWDVKTGKELRGFAHDLARMASFSADGRYLVTASYREARVWDAGTGSEMFREPIVHANLMVASFSSDGSLVITASGHPDRRGYGATRADNAVRFWDARTGDSRLVKDLKHGYEAMMVALDPGRRFVVFNSADREGGGRAETLRQDATARLWDVENRDKRLQRALPHDAGVSSASFSPDGRRMLTVSGAVARLWNAETGEPLVDLVHQKNVNAASFAPDGKLVVSAADDGTARVWEVETGAERFVARHQGSVERALLIANGKRLATISTRRLRVWSVKSGTAEIGEALLEVTDFGDEVTPDDFSADGRLVAARSGETAQVWDVETRKLRFTLKHGELS